MLVKPPQSENPRLDIAALSRIFKTFTNSYKFLYFQALLNSIRTSNNSTNGIEIRLKDLAVDMTVLAWYPKSYFHLEFGPQDQLGRILKRVRNDQIESIANQELQIQLRNDIEQNYKDLELEETLLRYVPYALLKPFFENETIRLEGNPYKRKIKVLTADHNGLFIPFCSFRGNNDSHIYIPGEWVEYLSRHQSILLAWAKYEWAKFLQRRNPNVPAIIDKLEPPNSRRSLTKQTKFWEQVIETRNLMCIYSNQPIEVGNFDLDHFIPWSFVTHDELWNLIPVRRETNRSKGNRLPSLGYITPFIELQHTALSVSKQHLTVTHWEKATEAYVAALKIDYSALTDKERLKSAYESVLSPLCAVAKQIGFSADWKFK